MLGFFAFFHHIGYDNASHVAQYDHQIPGVCSFKGIVNRTTRQWRLASADYGQYSRSVYRQLT